MAEKRAKFPLHNTNAIRQNSHSSRSSSHFFGISLDTRSFCPYFCPTNSQPFLSFSTCVSCMSAVICSLWCFHLMLMWKMMLSLASVAHSLATYSFHVCVLRSRFTQLFNVPHSNSTCDCLCGKHINSLCKMDLGTFCKLHSLFMSMRLGTIANCKCEKRLQTLSTMLNEWKLERIISLSHSRTI